MAERDRSAAPLSFGWVLLIGLLLGGGAWALRFAGPQVAVRLPVWVLLAPAAAALLCWIVLRARWYPPGGRALVAGAAVVGLVGAVGALLVVSARPEQPPGLPTELADLPVAEGVLPIDVQAAAVFRDEAGGTPLVVEFSPVTALDGLWAFSDAQVESPAFPDPVRVPDEPATWGETISTSDRDGGREVTPSYEAELPLTADSDRTAVTVVASMRLRYPSGGGFFFTEESRTVSRSAQLFIGSPEDRAYRAALDAWREGTRVGRWWPVLAGLGVLGLALAAVGGRQMARAGGRGGFGPAERAERDARVQARARRDALGDTGMVVAEEVVVRPGERGVVQQVAIRLGPPDPGSPAERAGVREGDVLITVDRSPLHSARATRSQILMWRPGDPHQVQVVRGRDEAVDVRLVV